MSTNKKKDQTDKYRVTLETAVILRKMRFPQHDISKSYFLGADAPSLSYGELLDFKVIKGNKYSVAAPTVHEVMDWLREKKDMFVEVTICPSKPLYIWRIKRTGNGETVVCQDSTHDSTKGFKSYKECCEAAILGCLHHISQES